jgi:pimeloyl-ACP methyl ester carboxylesterase
MQDNSIQVRDGRNLGYSDDGNAHGFPIFLFHGTPGSRVNGLENEPILSKYGIRVICPERPGYGLSSPKPKRTIKEWAEDVEDLANKLGITRFHVAGSSGGGPFALACAAYLPNRIQSVTLIASAVPPEALYLNKGMAKGNRIAFFLAKYFPFVLKLSMASYDRAIKKYPEKIIESLISQFCSWDREVLQKAEAKGEKLLLHYKEAFCQGGDGAYYDFLLISRPWGIELKSIVPPVFMWHGEADTLMPIGPAKAFSKMIPGCKSHFIPEAGHLLLESEEIGEKIITAILAVKS